MTVTAISRANLNAQLVTCSNYIENKDWANARLYLALAEVQYQGLAEETTDNSMTSKWRASLDGLKKAIDDAEHAAPESTARKASWTRARVIQ